MNNNEKLKQVIISELEFYVQGVNDIERRMREVPKGRKIYRDYRDRYIFYKGRVSAIRDLLGIMVENNLL